MVLLVVAGRSFSDPLDGSALEHAVGESLRFSWGRCTLKRRVESGWNHLRRKPKSSTDNPEDYDIWRRKPEKPSGKENEGKDGKPGEEAGDHIAVDASQELSTSAVGKPGEEAGDHFA